MKTMNITLALTTLLLLGACGEPPDQLRAQRYASMAQPGMVDATSLPPGAANAGNMTAADMAPVPLAPPPSLAPITAPEPMAVTTTTAATTVVATPAPAAVIVPVAVPVPMMPPAHREIATLKFGLTAPDYAPILNAAVEKTLKQNPHALFDIVVVTPSGGSDYQTDLEANRARVNGNAVMHAIMNYNVPVEHIEMNAAANGNDSGSEVRVYTR